MRDLSTNALCLTFIQDVWWSDEAHDYLQGDGNSQNLRIGSGIHPEAVDKSSLQSRIDDRYAPCINRARRHRLISFRKQREDHQSEPKKIKKGFQQSLAHCSGARDC